MILTQDLCKLKAGTQFIAGRYSFTYLMDVRVTWRRHLSPD